MKTLSKSTEGNPYQPVPQWIEPKVRLACRVMFKREPTSVDTMSCTGYGAQ